MEDQEARKAQKRVHTEQTFNFKYEGPQRTPKLHPHVYRVTKTHNTVEVSVTDLLTKERVQELIDTGTDVTVT